MMVVFWSFGLGFTRFVSFVTGSLSIGILYHFQGIIKTLMKMVFIYLIFNLVYVTAIMNQCVYQLHCPKYKAILESSPPYLEINQTLRCICCDDDVVVVAVRTNKRSSENFHICSRQN